MALRDLLDHAKWPTWEPGLRDRDPQRVADGPRAARRARSSSCASSSGCSRSSGASSRSTPRRRGVLLFGDLPIFVSHDSADVWAARELFQLDAEGQPTTVTGVPPDYFAADGQRWNNPHYDWDRMAADGFAWWRLRIARQRELFDLVRIDHFRGFEAAWHVPVEAETARDGYWVESPGREVLSALVDTAGPGTLVAEDLGVITPEVDAAADRVRAARHEGAPVRLRRLARTTRTCRERTGSRASSTPAPTTTTRRSGGGRGSTSRTRERVARTSSRIPTSRCRGRWSGWPWRRPRGWPSYPPRTCSGSAARPDEHARAPTRATGPGGPHPASFDAALAARVRGLVARLDTDRLVRLACFIRFV